MDQTIASAESSAGISGGAKDDAAARARAMLDEMKREQNQYMELAGHLSKYSNKSTLSSSDLDTIRREFDGTPQHSPIHVSNFTPPAGKNCSLTYADTMPEDMLRSHYEMLKKHFPSLEVARAHEAGSNRPVNILIGIDVRTANSVTRMEVAKLTAEQAVKDLGLKIEREAKKQANPYATPVQDPDIHKTRMMVSNQIYDISPDRITKGASPLQTPSQRSAIGKT